MSETIDRLIYALDGDLSRLKAAFAEADQEAAKSGQKVGQSFSKPMQQAADTATKSAQQMKTALGAGGDAASKAAKELDSLRLKYDSVYAATQKHAQVQSELNKLVAAGVLTQGAAAKKMEELAQAVTHSHGSVSTATREFRALFDELSSGRTRQTPGTLAIIATRVFGISGATLAWGAALLTIPAALAVAAFQAEATFSRIQRGLLATGYAAGVTTDQIHRMAQALDQTTHMSERGATQAIGALTARGNVGSALLPGGARAVAGYAAATGESMDKAGEALEKLLADPAKGAEELYSQFKMLTVAQQEEIKTLAASGEKEKAQAILIEAVNDRFGKLEDSSWSLAKAWDFISKGISDWWLHTGQKLSGAAGPQTKLEGINQQEAAIDAQLRQYGVGGIAGARSLLKRNPGAAEMGVGDMALGTLVGQYAALEAQKEPLQHQATLEAQKAKGGEFFRNQQDAVGYGLKLTQQYDEQGRKVKELTEQQAALNKALGLAIGPDVQFQDGIKKTKQAVDIALKAVKEYGDPAHEAALRAQEQARINAANPQNRARISAEVEAARGLRERLQNPATALEAQSIYQTEMKTADMPDRYNRQTEARATALKAMNQEADGAEALARAYDISTGAAERAKLESEAETKAIELHITNVKEATKFEDAYAAALEKRAFWQAAAQTAQGRETLQRADLGLQAELAAGGNPFAEAQAKREQEAFTPSIVAEFTGATNLEQHMQAYQDYQRQLAELQRRDQLTSYKSNADYLYTQKSSLQAAQTTANGFAAGFNDDDMRHLQVAQQTMDQLLKQGLDPTAQGFQEVYQQTLQVNEAMSDLNDALKNAQQYAGELAGDITGPLKKALLKGGDPKAILGDIGENLAGTLIQHQLIDPLNKSLTGMFGNALTGGALTADGTAAAPFYVVPVGPGGVPLVGGGGGDNPLGNLFGSDNPQSQGPGLLDNFLGTGPNASGGLFGTGGFAGSGGFLDTLFGGTPAGVSTTNAALSATDMPSFADISASDISTALPDLGAAGDVASAAGDSGGIMDALSSVLSFAGLFDDGGTIGPGEWGIKSGIPEIIQGGTAGVSIMPVTAPVVAAAIGSGPGTGGVNNGAGQSTTVAQGNTYNTFHLPGIRTAADAVQARSHLENAVTKAGDRGRRNS